MKLCHKSKLAPKLKMDKHLCRLQCLASSDDLTPGCNTVYHYKLLRLSMSAYVCLHPGVRGLRSFQVVTTSYESHILYFKWNTNIVEAETQQIILYLTKNTEPLVEPKRGFVKRTKQLLWFRNKSCPRPLVFIKLCNKIPTYGISRNSLWRLQLYILYVPEYSAVPSNTTCLHVLTYIKNNQNRLRLTWKNRNTYWN